MSQETEHLTHVQGLFLQNLPALRGFVVSLVSDFNLVDDVVQETFLVVTSKAAEFKRGSNFRAWAWTIARYKVLQALEKNAREQERLAPAVIEALCADAQAEAWATDEHLAFLRQCMDRLAPKARQAVELRYMQAHRPPEIARLMGWTVEAVHVALSRARNLLRECVEQRISISKV